MAIAASPFVLGTDYSEFGPPEITAMAADKLGSLYIASVCARKTGMIATSCITRLSNDGKSIVWQNDLGFPLPYRGTTMAVDSNGGVYVAAYDNLNAFVAKLNASGTDLEWKIQVEPGVVYGRYLALNSLAVDLQGRAYVAGPIGPDYKTSEIIRVGTDGMNIDYRAMLPGSVTSVAVNSLGAAFVTGDSSSGLYLARTEPDGSAGFYMSLSVAGRSGTVAVDPNGNAVVLSSGAGNSLLLQRFNAAGTLMISSIVQGDLPNLNTGNVLVDSDGNAYVLGTSYDFDKGVTYLTPLHNSLTTCEVAGTSGSWLKVFAPDGSLLQATYTPSANDSYSFGDSVPPMAFGPASSIIVARPAATTFSPTQSGPFTQVGFASGSFPYFLWRVSPQLQAHSLSLACLGSAATYAISPISPGAVVALFGNGLGPLQGKQLTATAQKPFPTEAAGVRVTFDGTPAPLLWVQDTQLNVVAPWSLTPGKTTQVCVTYDASKTNCLDWPVTDTSPAVFPAVLNQDGSLNSAANPATINSNLTIFVTGLGPTTPPLPDGALVGVPVPANALSVRIYSSLSFKTGPIITPFEVTYAGPAPNLVAGLSQITFKLTNVFGGVDLYVGTSSTTSTARVLPFHVYVETQ